MAEEGLGFASRFRGGVGESGAFEIVGGHVPLSAFAGFDVWHASLRLRYAKRKPSSNLPVCDRSRPELP